MAEAGIGLSPDALLLFFYAAYGPNVTPVTKFFQQFSPKTVPLGRYSPLKGVSPVGGKRAINGQQRRKRGATGRRATGRARRSTGWPCFFAAHPTAGVQQVGHWSLLSPMALSRQVPSGELFDEMQE